MDLQEAFDAGFEAVKKYIDDGFASYERRIAALEGARGIGLDDKAVAALTGALAPVIKDYIKAQVDPLERRLGDIEASGIKYCGVWQRANLYRKGSVVTEQGGAWVALGDSEGVRPGEGGTDAWQLLVRAGRDARSSN